MRFKGFQPGERKRSHLYFPQTPSGFDCFGRIFCFRKSNTSMRLGPYDPDLSAMSPSRAGVEVKARWVARRVAVKVTSAPDVRTSSRCLTRASRVPARSLREERGGGVGAWGRQAVSASPTALVSGGAPGPGGKQPHCTRFREGKRLASHSSVRGPDQPSTLARQLALRGEWASGEKPKL